VQSFKELPSAIFQRLAEVIWGVSMSFWSSSSTVSKSSNASAGYRFLAMFSVRIVVSLKINSFVEVNSLWKKTTAQMVGTTKVAMTVESKNFARKDHGFPLVFIRLQKEIGRVAGKLQGISSFLS